MGPAKPSSPESLYACPMHPGERSSEPGRCGICHMPLELVPVFSLAAPAWYYCPEHPEPQYTGPGKCPKCGKDLQRLEG